MSSLHFAPRVPVFDSNVSVGHRHDRPAPFEDASGLLAEMERHGVGRAVIHHVQAESISAIEGNEVLTEWVDDDGAFHLQWTAGPDAESLGQLGELHAAGKVGSVRVHDTQSADVPFADWLYGELLEWLNGQRIPLWVSLAESPAAEIVGTLRQFPSLVTVVLGAHYKHASVVRPLLSHLPNAYLELSRYEPLGDLEALIEAYGVHRFVYGSYYPRYAMGPMLFYLHHIGLGDAELSSVCAGNLERILGGESEG